MIYRYPPTWAQLAKTTMPPTARLVLQPVRKWTPRRKQEILTLIETGQVPAEQLMAFHNLSAEELEIWRTGAALGSKRFLGIAHTKTRMAALRSKIYHEGGKDER